MARDTASSPVPGTWIERLVTALAARHDLGLEDLLDADQALAAWYSAGMEPERAANLDEIDVAVGRWLRTFKSRSDYQRWLRLLANELGYRGPRPVRELVDRAATEPAVVETEVAEFIRTTDLKTDTVRSRVISLSSVVTTLHRATLAQRLLRVKLPPRDTNSSTVAPSPQAILAADRLLAEAPDSVSKRTRALLHLALLGVKPRELVALRMQDVHLEGNCIVLPRGARMFLSKAAAVALRAWIQRRGTLLGALFLGFDGRSGRLTDKAISSRQAQRALAVVGVEVGEGISPRELRRRPIVDAESRAIAAKVARVNNAGDLERVRSPRRGRTSAS